MEIKAGQAEIKNKIITAVQEQLRSKEEHVKGKSNNPTKHVEERVGKIEKNSIYN